MVSLYKTSVGDLAKNAHHDSMSDVHADLAQHHVSMFESSSPESRKASFHAAAIAHHKSQAHANATSALEKPDSRQFSSHFKETDSNPGMAENNSYGLFPNRRAPHVTNHPITGDPESFIPDAKLTSRRNEWLGEQAGTGYHPPMPEDTASNSYLKGKRFI